MERWCQELIGAYQEGLFSTMSMSLPTINEVLLQRVLLLDEWTYTLHNCVSTFLNIWYVFMLTECAWIDIYI